MSASLEARVRALVQDEERITFARFMEMALYDPDGGYYMRPGRVGESGDFFTSPSIHPAFGALICVQLREMWELLGSPDEYAVVEMGAGSGLLSEDISRYAPELDASFAAALRAYPLDRSSSGAEVPEQAVGCVISNELLDAMPVHRFTVEDGVVRELWVVERDGKLVEEAGELSDLAIGERLQPVASELSDRYVGEVCLDLSAWAMGVSEILERGFVLTVDYGYPRNLLYSEERRRGTLRCYYRHTLNMSPFEHIGEQDLSVHVDFDAVDEALGAEGFVAVGKTSQASFLERLGIDRAIRGGGPDRLALRELVKPHGLGGFVVAVHSKGVDDPQLRGLGAGTTGDDSPALPMLDGDPRRLRPGGGFGQIEATWEELLGGGLPPDKH